MMLDVGNTRTCRVTCRDVDGVEHSVEVSAESLYEAVALGLCALKASPWVGDIGEGLTTITVEVREQAAVTHQVHMKDFRKWLDARGTTPAQITAKDRVPAILVAAPEPDRPRRRQLQAERNIVTRRALRLSCGPDR